MLKVAFFMKRCSNNVYSRRVAFRAGSGGVFRLAMLLLALLLVLLPPQPLLIPFLDTGLLVRRISVGADGDGFGAFEVRPCCCRLVPGRLRVFPRLPTSCHP